MTNTQLELTAYKIRKHAIDGVYNAASGHPGGSLSISDILSVLYFDEMNVNPANPAERPFCSFQRSLRTGSLWCSCRERIFPQGRYRYPS